MTNRIVEISERAVGLRIANRLLEITLKDGEQVTVQPAEIAVLLLANPRIRLSQAVLTTVTEQGGFVVAVNERFMPSAMVLPLAAHSTHSEILRAQIEAGVPLKKRLWRQLVREKVRAQGMLLKMVHGTDHGLLALVDRVKSGDADNVEARAARVYWRVVFNDPSFVRDRDADDQNALLNYGYTVLRAAVARAVCAAGLMPSMGLHHHNRYNAFCLVDDLMEPFRPLVDRVVVSVVTDLGPAATLTPEHKRQLLEPLMGDVRTERGNEKLFALLSRMASSLVRCFNGEAEELVVPESIL